LYDDLVILVVLVEAFYHLINCFIGEVFLSESNCAEILFSADFSSSFEVIHEGSIKLLVESTEPSEFAYKVSLVFRQAYLVVELIKPLVPDVVYDVHLFDNSIMGNSSLFGLLRAMSSTSPSTSARRAAAFSKLSFKVPVPVELSLAELLLNLFVVVIVQVWLISIVYLSHVNFIGKSVVGFEFSEPADE